MITECEGIVVKQTKILKGRRMILLLTDRFGKISAGTSVSERGKSRSALAIRPFTVGRYQLRKNRGFTDITSGETVKSYFELSENYDKFLSASLAVELTSKALPEEAPAGDIYAALIEFLDMMLRRSRNLTTLTNAYMVKLLQAFGVFPEANDFRGSELLLTLDSDIVNVLMFLRGNPLSRVEKLALDDEISARLLRFLIRYAEAHLDIGRLKSALPLEESSKGQP
ncbi:MAG: DNA repair protein RecO [Clostridiales Family XIII bacterium]|jgi:DNA repair protein RecO (recombination protein O)|nr:DNA repair protein RecO [Clostridiales Family XIII bacterium]